MPQSAAPPPPDSLAARARRAARERRDDARTPATWRDENWAERAHTAARNLADLLAVARDCVQIVPDYSRAYGAWVWPRMTITDLPGAAHWFVAAFNDPARLLALGSCPDCGGQVPLTWIRTLADYGEHLEGTAPAPGTFDHVPEFRGDPGHRARCPHAHLH